MEAVFEQKNIAFEYAPMIPLAEITRSRDSQIRPDTSPDIVKLYAEMMRAGSLFPPAIVRPNPAGGYVLLHGNHTTEAKRIVDPNGHIDVYITEPISDDQALQISGMFNAHHGLRPTKAESQTYALVLQRREYTPDQIARDTGIPASTLRKLVSVYAFDKRATALGIDADLLTKQVKPHIQKITLDSVFCAVCSLVVDAGLGTSATAELVNAVKDLPSENEALKFVADQRLERDEQIKARRDGRDLSSPPSIEARRVIGHLLALCAKYPDKTAWLPARPEALVEWREKMVHAVACMTDLLAAYDDAL